MSQDSNFKVPIVIPNANKKFKGSNVAMARNKHGVYVGQDELAKLFGCTVNTIIDYRDKGMPHEKDPKKKSKLRFDTAVCIRWRLQLEQDRAVAKYNERPKDPEEGLITIAEAKRRKEVSTMLLSELELAKEREQVANIDDLMLNFSEALVQVRAKLVSLPSRIAGHIAHQDESDVIRILDAEIKDTLFSLSDYDHKYVDGDSDG